MLSTWDFADGPRVAEFAWGIYAPAAQAVPRWGWSLFDRGEKGRFPVFI